MFSHKQKGRQGKMSKKKQQQGGSGTQISAIGDVKSDYLDYDVECYIVGKLTLS